MLNHLYPWVSFTFGTRGHVPSVLFLFLFYFKKMTHSISQDFNVLTDVMKDYLHHGMLTKKMKMLTRLNLAAADSVVK